MEGEAVNATVDEGFDTGTVGYFYRIVMVLVFLATAGTVVTGGYGFANSVAVPFTELPLAAAAAAAARAAFVALLLELCLTLG
mmetsp:Transcript_41086/g.53896  ORF Transcript_41086/g.53896 Transcript_41086/m.53896 type:complete len:83 (+) Transcript_41086:1680-1928(+)